MADECAYEGVIVEVNNSLKGAGVDKGVVGIDLEEEKTPRGSIGDKRAKKASESGFRFWDGNEVIVEMMSEPEVMNLKISTAEMDWDAVLNLRK